MPEEYAPSLGAGLTLLNLFGFNSTTTKIIGTLIVILVVGCVFIRFRYPCRSPSSLMQIVEEARTLFDKCLATHAFDEGEYDRFNRSLQQITAHTLGISSRIYRSSRHHGYLKRCLFLWKRLKDIVECHRKARLLIRDLEVCLMRASLSRAEYELRRVQPTLTCSNPEPLRPADGYSVEMIA